MLEKNLKRVLLVDLDIQPTLSSYFQLTREAPAGILELLAQGCTNPQSLISRINKADSTVDSKIITDSLRKTFADELRGSL